MSSVYTDSEGTEHVAKLVNVIMPVELINAIDEVRGKISRADWIRAACLESLPKKVRPEVIMRRPGNPNAAAVST